MQQSQFRPGRFFLIGLVIIVAVVIADQYTKWLVLETMLRTDSDAPGFLQWFTTRRPVSHFLDQQETYNTVRLAPFLNFVMVWNRGISFGMFDAGGAKLPVVFIGISLLISMGLFIWMILVRRPLVTAATALIIGGALGNVIDRARFGAVADFIDVHVAGKHWPAFNLADSCVVIGAALLVLEAIIVPVKNVPAKA